MTRRLNLTCIMKLSKILKKLGIRNYIKEMTSANMETMLQEVKKVAEKEQIPENAMNEQKMIIALDVFGWVFENIGEAEDEFCELFKIYTGEAENAVRNWDADKTIEIFQEMFTNGIPKVLKNLINVDEIKKKLSSMTEQ